MYALVQQELEMSNSNLKKDQSLRKWAKRQPQDLWLKDWHNNYSWDLIKSRLKKEEESQCPFKWMWKK